VVSKRYTPDKNQAIYRMMTANRSDILKSYESVVGTSTNQADDAYHLLTTLMQMSL
jgi:hypothetical protein